MVQIDWFFPFDLNLKIDLTTPSFLRYLSKGEGVREKDLKKFLEPKATSKKSSEISFKFHSLMDSFIESFGNIN